MDAQRLNASLELIQQLLDCPKGQELALLKANESLIDAEFIQLMRQLAAQMAAEGDNATANFLQEWAIELKQALLRVSANGHVQPESRGDRAEAYMNLIKELLSCRKGSEAEILQANAHLMDAGLVQQMEQVVALLSDKGDAADANFLAGLARQLAVNLSGSVSRSLSFLQQILQVIQKTGGNLQNERNLQAICSLLQENVAQLNAAFVHTLHTWAETTLAAAAPKQALKLAADLVIFSDLVQQIPEGNAVDLQEIALAGYQIALPFFSHETFPQQRAVIQKHLGEAYCQRTTGDKAENLEAAIHCFHDTLQVYTRKAFPQEWAMVQKDLGDAYHHRVRGDHTENLEKAVTAYAAALQVYTGEAVQ